jgi:hypothetical protein
VLVFYFSSVSWALPLGLILFVLHFMLISDISEVFDLKEPTAGQNICWWQIELKISLAHKPPIVQAYYKVIHNLQLTLPSLQSGNIFIFLRYI